MEENNKPQEISKVKIEDTIYNFKDAELRRGIEAFLGDVKKESEERKKVDGLSN